MQMGRLLALMGILSVRFVMPFRLWLNPNMKIMACGSVSLDHASRSAVVEGESRPPIQLDRDRLLRMPSWRGCSATS
jgi:hypothetical protein